MATVKSKPADKQPDKPDDKQPDTPDDPPKATKSTAKKSSAKAKKSDDGEPSEAVATGYQVHPIGVDVECSSCGAKTVATWPFDHCWKCGNRDWKDD